MIPDEDVDPASTTTNKTFKDVGCSPVKRLSRSVGCSPIHQENTQERSSPPFPGVDNDGINPVSRRFPWLSEFPYKQFIEKIFGSRNRDGHKIFRVMWGPSHIIDSEDKSVLIQERTGLSLWLRELRFRSSRKFNAVIRANPDFAAFL